MGVTRPRGRLVVALVAVLGAAAAPGASGTPGARVSHPFPGVTYIDRTEASPRPEHMRIVQIDLDAPGLRFELSPPAGDRETVRQRTLELTLFTVDARGGSLGMRVGEVADVLIADYGVWNALNLDGGGSTSMAMQDPKTGQSTLVNTSSDNPAGRAVGSSLAVFARVR